MNIFGNFYARRSCNFQKYFKFYGFFPTLFEILLVKTLWERIHHTSKVKALQMMYPVLIPRDHLTLKLPPPFDRLKCWAVSLLSSSSTNIIQNWTDFHVTETQIRISFYSLGRQSKFNHRHEGRTQVVVNAFFMLLMN